MPLLDKKETDKRNFEFVTGSLKQMEQRNASFIVALALSETGELMILNTPLFSNKEIWQLLNEAANALQNKKDGGLIIPLN